MRSRVLLADGPAWISAGLALALAAGLYVAALALGYDPTAFASAEATARGETPGFFAAMVGGAGLAVLTGALLVGSRGAVGVSVALLLGGWAMTLVAAGPEIRVDFVVAGAGHLLVAEIAYWSIEFRSDGASLAAAVVVVRAGELVAVLAAVGLLGWALVGLASGGPGGAVVDLVAVAAVLGFGVVVVTVTRSTRSNGP